MNFLEALKMAKGTIYLISTKELVKSNIGYKSYNIGAVTKIFGNKPESDGIKLSASEFLGDNWIVVNSLFEEIDIFKIKENEKNEQIEDIFKKVKILENKMDAIKDFFSKLSGE